MWKNGHFKEYFQSFLLESLNNFIVSCSVILQSILFARSAVLLDQGLCCISHKTIFDWNHFRIGKWFHYFILYCNIVINFRFSFSSFAWKFFTEDICCICEKILYLCLIFINKWRFKNSNFYLRVVDFFNFFRIFRPYYIIFYEKYGLGHIRPTIYSSTNDKLIYFCSKNNFLNHNNLSQSEFSRTSKFKIQRKILCDFRPRISQKFHVKKWKSSIESAICL